MFNQQLHTSTANARPTQGFGHCEFKQQLIFWVSNLEPVPFTCILIDILSNVLFSRSRAGMPVSCAGSHLHVPNASLPLGNVCTVKTTSQEHHQGSKEQFVLESSRPLTDIEGSSISNTLRHARCPLLQVCPVLAWALRFVGSSIEPPAAWVMLKQTI